ncbi:CRISPR-associated helicase Cas3' [Campylobacter geochelonis]|uniref:CRISPR-associated helicase Cas3 domain-containing protein n=1 Tax=Campylobacter geochelonis TaxID=1780362 RepID=A0A128EFU0_9BACT|nr:CRISPR-associated helicase Cas3' [Campylobacter geochelonis]QKF70971.1 CRISPR/Cas system-associated endonuclease/helicase Cas3, type I-B [Campylobacter geochelonis]CZE47063.1 CRISPR-associated helicase Cas3 domain-containing protein [Campylobacter geochelonis]
MLCVDSNIWAHTKKDKEPETLKEHSKLTKKYLQNIKKAKSLDGLIVNLSKKILEDESLIKIFDELIIWHDIGKTNPAFQTLKMKNPAFNTKNISTAHSDKSFEFLKEHYKEFIFKKAKENSKIAYRFVCIFYHLLSNVLNHHGSLKDGFDEKYLSDINNLDNAFKSSLNLVEFDLSFFIFIKLHFSLLIASDFYATSEYMNELSISDFGVFDKDKKEAILAKFSKFYTTLKPTKEIDTLRAKIYKTAEKNLLKNSDKNIFYLEAPTGSGKTITSLNLALNLLKSEQNLNKIFYVFPFNTLISQSKAVFDSIFENELEIAVANSITSPEFRENEQEDKESNYDKTYINRLFFNSPFVLTSHVGLFKILFGITKEENYPLYSLANSVIILDEIQSYNPNLWEFMAFFFDKFAKALNIKFIIMSATLPKISSMLENEDNWCDLLPNSRDIFQNKLFKDRVKVDFSLLATPKDEIFEKLVEITKEHKDKKILFEFITKNSAREFFNYIKDKFDGYDIFELSGDDNKLYQKQAIEKLKTDIKAIVVATQVIEAGVDIDMDLGFKNIATIESEEQFLGRINRSSLKMGALVYFFEYDDKKRVYNDDERMKFSLKDEKLRIIFENKDFTPYYKMLLKELQTKNSKAKNSLKTMRENFIEDIKKLNFKSISEKMQLINDNRVRVFLPFKLDISGYNMDEYGDISEFLTDGLLDGSKVWQRICEQNNVESFSRKRLNALKLNALSDIFSFSVYPYKTLPKMQFSFCFIENYKEFVDENGKFNRTNFAKTYNNQELFV